MHKSIRILLLCEGIAFIIASMIHLGVLMHGHQHRPAGIAEGIIGLVLLVGFVSTWILPGWIRGIGVAAQTFALLGTAIGIYTIAIGIGPRTLPDIAFHVAIVITLIAGLIVAFRARKLAGVNAPHQSLQS